MLALITLGANLPFGTLSGAALLNHAIDAMAGEGFFLSARSSFWASPSWPDSSKPDYINAVVAAEDAAGLGPHKAMTRLLDIEREHGRTRGARNAPRTLDLDIVDWGGRIELGQDLILPHPRAHLRDFVMFPLLEIAPDWRHPVLGLEGRDIAQRLAAKGSAARRVGEAG